MSPTEHELRAALHDGEGDGFDPARAIIAGDRVRARRRTRLINSVAAAVVVGGVATGGAFLVGSQSQENASSSADGGGKQANQAERSSEYAAAAPQSAAAGAGGASVRAPGASVVGCSPTVARQSPPTGTAPGPLFAGRVSSLLVCTYSTEGGRTSVSLTGDDAKVVVDSLETAAAAKPSGMCPLYRIADERTVEFIGVTAEGQSAGVVTTTLDRPACATVVTNGKAIRYGWHPPVQLLSRLAKAQPADGSSAGPVQPAGTPTK